MRRAIASALAALLTAACAGARAQEVSEHVAPPPPEHPMPPMSAEQMDQVMDMHDDPLLAMLTFDQFERAWGDTSSTNWDADGWIGHDYDKLWLRSEGEREDGHSDLRFEAFWDHAFATWWDWQLGARHDAGSGAARDWLAFGLQGLAPYWFEVEATAYVGPAGRSAFRLRAEYELLLTQRWVLQPEVELNLYSRGDATREVRAGLSDAEFGLRLRYEVRREFAPYVGVTWQRRFGAPPAHDGLDTRLVAGVRFWF